MVNRASGRTTRALVDEIQKDYLTKCELSKSLHISETIALNDAKFGMLILLIKGATRIEGILKQGFILVILNLNFF